MFLLIDEI
jgi:transmembrane 9 superfamily protein 3